MKWIARPRRQAFEFLIIGLTCVAFSAHASLPDWVSAPPADNQIAFFGVGEGPSINEATQQALRSIAGKLNTRISSESVSSGSISGGVASESYQETVKAYVEDVKLSSYTVNQTQMVNGRYFALVEMSREDFIRDTRLQLQSTEADIERRMSQELGARAFERFRACQVVTSLIGQAHYLNTLLSTADTFHEASPLMARHDAYQRDCAQALQGLTLQLKSPESLHPVAEALSQQLTVPVSTSDYSDGRLDLRGSPVVTELFGDRSAVIDITVALVDDRNSTVASKSYRLNGRSRISREEAVLDAQRKFIASGGVDKILADLRLQ